MPESLPGATTALHARIAELEREIAAARQKYEWLREEALRFMACDRCTQGAMDADNPHHPKKRSCSCACHNTARRIAALASAANAALEWAGSSHDASAAICRALAAELRERMPK